MEDGKEIIELETVEEQYNVFSSYKLDTQVKMLEHTLQTYNQQADWINQLGHSWVHSNGSSSEKELIDIVTNDLKRADEDYQKEMNDTRNIKMVQKLDDILQSESKQTYFVVVGSGHTLIDPSLPSELRDKGYNVERVY
ncbi:TraB/GumN family protein [Oceanobacillus kapialis]|uniref:TraB/GumN family protein n=1 Tax=Oceanobacillus kapialis TaxID=481353 RepID=UPI00385014EB